MPDPVLDVSAEFNADAAQNEQPQDNGQRKVEPAEGGRVESREYKVECAAGGEQPDFVAIPHRTDGAQHSASFVVRLGCKQINRARAKIKSVQPDLAPDH